MNELEYCDLCGCDTRHQIVLDKIYDNENIVYSPFNIVECKKCRHCHLQPFPRDFDEAGSFYPKNYYAHVLSSNNGFKSKLKTILKKKYYKNSLDKSLFNAIIYLLFKHTINESPLIKNCKLCDIGSGNGEYISELQSYGIDVCGVEANKSVVADCVSKGIKVKHGYAENIPYENDIFDIVRMWNVLEHCISPKKALEEAARILKKNMYLILYVPNFESIDLKVFGRFWANLEVPRHLHHFRYNDLETYFKKTVFASIKYYTRGLYILE